MQLVPTQDSIQEFRVQTNSVTADFGRFGGGVVNLTSRSGSNEFHGSAYQFLRNRVLNSNTFFNNRSNVGRPAFTQNQFGANAGGPIFRDKTFFFASYEAFRLRQGNSVLRSVPTPELREGNFSNWRTASGALIPIYDPMTTCGTGSNPACNAGQTALRQPFPGNVIPAARFDPSAVKLRSLWALPNLPGQPNTSINNFARNSSSGGDNDQINIRLDQNVSSRQRVFARYTNWTNTRLPDDVFLTNTGTAIDFGSQQGVIADTYTFNPTTVADIRFAAFNFYYTSLPQSTGVDLSTFGWPSSLNSDVTSRHVPYPCVQNFSAFCQAVTSEAVNNSYSLAPSLTKIHGRHTIRTGGDLRILQFNFGKSNQSSGVFNFDNLFTSRNPYSPGNTGTGWASYLLGFGAAGQIPGVTGSPNRIQTFARAAGQMWYQGYYVTDTFQLSQKLTLNFGLRWDIASPYTERFDRQSVLLPFAESPLAKATGLPLTGRLGLVNSPDNPPRGSQKVFRNLVAPRFGFAYRLDNKTVIRSGAGLYFLPNDATFNLSPHNHPINQIITPWVTTLDGGLTPVNRLSAPFPQGILQPPARDASYQSSLYGQSISSPIFDQPYPYMMQWNFNIQRELFFGAVADIAYAGSRGVHLLTSGQQLNQLPVELMSRGTELQRQVPNPFFGLITQGNLSAPRVAQGQLLTPYPQYTGMSIISYSNRDSNYHSMQLKMEKRFRNGGTVMGAYTVSKIITTAETLTGWLDATGTTQYANNLRQERSLMGTDVPQRLVVSYVYDLPFGKGQTLLGNASGIANRVVSGWGLNGVSTFQKGFPLALTTNVNLTNSFGGGSRPNVVAGCAKEIGGPAQANLGRWFNTGCFSQPPAFTFGSESRTDPQLRLHGINNFDFALFKNNAITERLGLQFRAEVFNLFNRVQFGAPGVAAGNPNFGVIGSQANNPRLIQFALRLQY